jgi:hypothetical protein
MRARKLGILLGNTENLGDSIISIATNNIVAAKCILDRDTGQHLNTCSDWRAHRVLVTGWLTHNPENWPLRMHEAKFNSIHISKTVRNGTESSKIFFNGDTIEKMRESGPIGCRDFSTLSLVRDLGLDGYFSGCVTMTLTATEVPTKRKIALVDTPPAVAEYFRSSRKYEVLEISHEISPTIKWSEKLINGQQLLDVYNTCEFVVSTRLHAVIPALALGAKSCLIMNDKQDARFEPLRKYIPSIELSRIDSMSKVLDSSDSASPAFFELAQSLKEDITAWV